MSQHVPCDRCEELLQGYLDRELTDAEVVIAEAHLEACDYCRRRYTFEASLRRYVKTTAAERIPAAAHITSASAVETTIDQPEVSAAASEATRPGSVMRPSRTAIQPSARTRSC